MFRTQRSFKNRQRPLIKGLGLSVFALGPADARQIVETRRYVRMLWAQCLFTNRQGALVKGFGLFVSQHSALNLESGQSSPRISGGVTASFKEPYESPKRCASWMGSTRFADIGPSKK